MIKHRIEWIARARFAIPVVVGLALAAMLVNELAFQHTRRIISRGIALTDARMQATATLQAMTVMEAAARSAMTLDHPDIRQRFEAASRSYLSARQKTLQLIEQLDNDGVVGVARLRQLSDEQAARYRAWLEQAPGAPGVAAGGSDASSRADIAELQAEFDAVLAAAAAAQQQARVSIYNALQFNRIAVHSLVLLSVLGLGLFARELRRSDVARAQEHERLAAQVKERTANLHDLADHLTTVREDERGRLARDLHDEMGGLMTAMKLELARLRRLPELPAVALERMANIETRLNEGIAFKRRIIESLRPSSLDQLGLKVALEMLCADTASVMVMPVQVDIQDLNLGSDCDLTVYRIVQESLTNIAKYASASTVWVSLKLSSARSEAASHGMVTLTVRDDGRGFDPSTVSSGRHGLLGMQVRVEGHQGSLRVLSSVGQGTHIVASFPLSAAAPTPSRA